MNITSKYDVASDLWLNCIAGQVIIFVIFFLKGQFTKITKYKLVVSFENQEIVSV